MGAARLGVCSQGQPPNPGRALRLPKFRRVGGCRCGARAPRRVSLVSPAHPRSRLLPAPPFPPSPVHPGPGLASAPPGPLPHQSFSVPCPVGTHRAPVAPGGGRVRICSGRGWRLRVCVRRGGGRSPAAAGLSGWRSTRAGRSPCGGCLCVFGSCAGGGGVDRSRGWRGRPAPRTLRLVWRESEGENGERWYPRWRCEGGSGVPRPSLPPSVGAFAPHAAARGGRGPWPPWLFFVSASPSPGRYPLRRRPAGRRGVRAPMRVTPGCCEFGEGEGLADPLRPGFPGGDPASVGCASRGLRVSKILHPRRPPLPPASRGPPETVRRLVLPCRRVPSLSRPPPRSLLPAAGRVSPLSDRDLRSDVATR